MSGNHELMYHEMRDRILGALPALPHRGNHRLADDLDIQDLPQRVLHHPVKWYGSKGKDEGRTTTIANFLAWIDSGLSTLMNGINKSNEGIAGLTAAVAAMSAKQGIDPAELAKIVDAAVKASVKDSLGTYELTRVDG